jgi:alkanesulfonate monooxygenase
VRVARLREALEIVTAMLAGETVTFDGSHHRADGAHAMPAPVQTPRPPVFVGGKGDRIIRLAVELADGWNTCWVWTPQAYRERLDVVESACASFARDPDTFSRSLGLYALCGTDEHDLERRFLRLVERTPKGVIDGMPLAEWRQGRLVGTVEQIREQAATWRDLGVESLILGVGALPFQVSDLEDVELLAEALKAV